MEKVWNAVKGKLLLPILLLLIVGFNYLAQAYGGTVG